MASRDTVNLRMGSQRVRYVTAWTKVGYLVPSRIALAETERSPGHRAKPEAADQRSDWARLLWRCLQVESGPACVAEGGKRYLHETTVKDGR
jgi:hypothetical protein